MDSMTAEAFAHHVAHMEAAFDNSWVRTNHWVRKFTNGFTLHIETEMGGLVRAYLTSIDITTKKEVSCDCTEVYVNERGTYKNMKRMGMKRLNPTWRNTLSGEWTAHNPLI